MASSKTSTPKPQPKEPKADKPLEPQTPQWLKDQDEAWSGW